MTAPAKVDLPPQLSAEEARECLRHIMDAAAMTWQWVTKAYLGRAWVALGYDSWDAMCDAELGGTRLRLPREERREIVGSLREQGMSTRAIGSALGVSDHTVRKDLPTARNHAVERVTSLDGRSRPAYRPDPPVIEGEVVERSAPRAPRTDVVRVINAALIKAQDAAALADQIKPAHLRDRNEEAAAWGCDLSRSMKSLQRLLDALESS